MPITQARMIEQMQEARAAHTAFRQLREQVLAICAGAKSRYYNNPDLQNVLDALISHVGLLPTPTDQATYFNERHYQRHQKHNTKTRERQEVARRMAGVPTVEEAMAILHGKNALRRADLPTSPAAYSDNHAPLVPVGKSDQERRAEELLAADPFTAPAKPSRAGIILPRDDPDDPELEFETPEELAPIANLPTGALADPLLGENNFKEGIDNPSEQEQDANGNPAKESGT
jgi:hypothetical protein